MSLTLKELHDELIEATETVSCGGFAETSKPDLHWARKLRDAAEEYIQTYELEINLIDEDLEDEEDLDISKDEDEE